MSKSVRFQKLRVGVALMVAVSMGSFCAPAGTPTVDRDGQSSPTWLEQIQSGLVPRIAAADGVTAVVDVALLKLPGKLPKKAVVKVPESALGDEVSGAEGLAVVVAAGSASLAPAKAANKIVAITKGDRNSASWDNQLGGAIACVTPKTARNGRAPKNLKMVVRGKGLQQLLPGTILTVVVVRFPLSLVGATPGTLSGFCKGIPDLLDDLL